MPTVNDLLRDADPLRHEEPPDARRRERLRQSVIAAAANPATGARPWFRAPLAVAALAVMLVVAGVAAGMRAGGAVAYAAVRFEVHLAETEAAPGLREMRVPGSERVLYVHDEVVVSNADIDSASAIGGDAGSHYNIGVRFNAAGAEKMRRATLEHEGRPLVILIDGEIAMAPVIRSPIGASAMITGNYSKAEAERIVNGIRGR